MAHPGVGKEPESASTKVGAAQYGECVSDGPRDRNGNGAG